MTKFLDGPAAGVVLELRRAPILLRAVRSVSTGKWDALDQLDDTPADDETVFVYRIVGQPGWIHVDRRDKAGRRRGETRVIAEYRLLPEQPAGEHLRDTDAWGAWAVAWVEREFPD